MCVYIYVCVCVYIYITVSYLCRVRCNLFIILYTILTGGNGEGAVIPEYTNSLYNAVAKHALTAPALVGEYSELEPCLGGY